MKINDYTEEGRSYQLNKITYLNELEYRLDKLPSRQVDEIMSQYENIFYEEGAKGKTDKDIIRKLDTPKKIAKQKYAAYAVKNAERKPDFKHILSALIATIGISLITLLIVMIPLLIVLLIILVGTFISIGMVLAPVLVIISSIWVGLQYFSLSNLIFSISFLGLGIIFVVIILKLLLLVRYAIIKYLTWNIQLFKKGKIK